jgi:hypothetical protein
VNHQDREKVNSFERRNLWLRFADQVEDLKPNPQLASIWHRSFSGEIRLQNFAREN